MFDLNNDKARVRLDFGVGGKKFKKGQWLKGSFMFGGGSLYFEYNELCLVPDCFDLFEVSAHTLQEVFDADFGYANDREEYWEEMKEDIDE